MMRKTFKVIGVILLLAVVYVGFTTYPKLDLISGFSAKSVASGYFIDDRSKDLIDLATNTIDEAGKFATASVYGLKERKAIYREGLGATLIDDEFDTSKPYDTPKRNKKANNLIYPYGDGEQKDTVLAEKPEIKSNLG